MFITNQAMRERSLISFLLLRILMQADISRQD